MNHTMGTKSTSSSFLEQLFSFSLGPVFGAVFSFCASIIITWLVIPDDVGKVSMFTTVLTLLSLFTNLGLDRAYMREFSATNRKEELLFTCLSLSLLSSLTIVFLIILLKNDVAYFLFDNNDIISVLLLAIILPVNVFGDYGVNLCRLKVDTKKYTTVVLTEKVSYLLFIFLFFYFWVDYRAIVVARCSSILCKASFAFLLERRSFKMFSHYDHAMVKRVLLYGVPYMPALIFSWVLHSMDKFALRIWSSYEEIGYYATAFSIVSMLAILQTAFSSFWTPLAYKWYEEGKSVLYFEKVGKILMSILMLCSGMVILLRNVILLFYSPDFSIASTMIPFLLLLVSMETMSYVVGCGINLKRKTVYNTVASLAACIVNLLGNYLLVPMYGGLGASFSTGLSCIVFMLVKMFVSRYIWYKFPCAYIIINVFLILLLDSVAVLANNYFIEVLIFTLLIAYNYKAYAMLRKYLASFTTQTLNNFKIRL